MATHRELHEAERAERYAWRTLLAEIRRPDDDGNKSRRERAARDRHRAARDRVRRLRDELSK